MPNIETIILTANMCDDEFLRNGQICLYCPRDEIINKKCNLVIPDKINGIKITEIYNEGFANCNNIISVNMSQSIKKIGESAFYHCEGLKSINVPDGIKSIEENTFYNCTSLTSIDLPNSIVEIHDFAFSRCGNLESINIPSNVGTLTMGSFSHCSSLKTVNLPQDMTEISSDVFDDCINLSQITLPSSISKLSEWAFENCSNLQIIYNGTQEQLDKIVSKELQDTFKHRTTSIFAAKEINEYLNSVINNKDVDIPIINNSAQQNYLLNELNNIIKGTADINIKLKLLTQRDEIDKQITYEKNNEIER